MASVNRVTIIGHLGQDPEARYLPSGDALTNISVATTDKWRDKATGESKENTEWHRVVMFGKTAEVASQYLKKGSSVYIEGKLQTRKWQGKDGQDRYTTEIRADTMQMLGSPGERSGASADKPAERKSAPAGGTVRTPAKQTGGSFDDMPDDLDVPF